MTAIPQRQSETEAYISLLRRRRGEIRTILAGLPPAALNWLPVSSPPDQPKTTNSIYQLAYHCVVTEVDWRRHIAYRLGQITRQEEEAGFEEGEFEVVSDDLTFLLGRLESDGQKTDDYIASMTEQQLSVTWLNPRGERRSVRWIIGHIIAHYGEHIGQMALTRRLWEAR